MPCSRSPRVRTQMRQNREPKFSLMLLEVAQFRGRPWRARRGFSVFREPPTGRSWLLAGVLSAPLSLRGRSLRRPEAVILPRLLSREEVELGSVRYLHRV